MNVTTLRTKAENQLREQFDDAATTLPGTGWVKTLRESAIAAFAADGLPHRRVEEWKYTDLRERLRDVPAPVAATSKAVSTADLDRALGRPGDARRRAHRARRRYLSRRPVEGHGRRHGDRADVARRDAGEGAGMARS